MMKMVGIAAALNGIILVILLGSNMGAFIDIPALLFVILVGFGILIAAHGVKAVMACFFRLPGIQTQVDGHVIAETGITAFVAAGWIGTLVGVVQILSALEDPSQIGMGAAVALLSAFYGYVAAYAICYPISRQRLA